MLLVLQWEGGGEREGDCFWLLQRRRARGLDAEERRGGERQTIRRSRSRIEEIRSRLQIDVSVAAGSRPAPAIELFEAE
ncbi:hypothetical protein OIU84_008083, partial [Salix udensis]